MSSPAARAVVLTLLLSLFGTLLGDDLGRGVTRNLGIRPNGVASNSLLLPPNSIELSATRVPHVWLQTSRYAAPRVGRRTHLQ